MATIKEVKLKPKEKVIMEAIEQNGEFLWDSIHHPELKLTLKDLMWREFIERKKTNGLSVNVFVGGWHSELLFENNRLAKLVNQ